MNFDIKNFSVCEITGTDVIAKWVIKEGFTTAAAEPSGDFIKITVKEWDSENKEYKIISEFENLKNEIDLIIEEIWICWDMQDEEMIEWWITGDNV